MACKSAIFVRRTCLCTAQVRSRAQLSERMCALAGADVPAGCRAADALLCVSGSHPGRHVPGLRRWGLGFRPPPCPCFRAVLKY